jgi:hypothetical protein
MATFLRSFVPPLNFVLIVMLIMGVAHLLNSTNTYSNCTAGENQGSCVMFRTSDGVCTSWTCLLFSITMIAIPIIMFILQIPWIQRSMLKRAGGTFSIGYKFLLLSPMLFAAIVSAVTAFPWKSKQKTTSLQLLRNESSATTAETSTAQTTVSALVLALLIFLVVLVCVFGDGFSCMLMLVAAIN